MGKETTAKLCENKIRKKLSKALLFYWLIDNMFYFVNYQLALITVILMVVPMYGSSFNVFTHFTHAHFIFLHNAVTTLFIMVLGGSGSL